MWSKESEILWLISLVNDKRTLTSVHVHNVQNVNISTFKISSGFDIRLLSEEGNFSIKSSEKGPPKTKIVERYSRIFPNESHHWIISESNTEFSAHYYSNRNWFYGSRPTFIHSWIDMLSIPLSKMVLNIIQFIYSNYNRIPTTTLT